MKTSSSERTIRMLDSSWELLDAAAELDGELTVGQVLDSIGQGFCKTDDGQAVDRQTALLKLKRLFGGNHG